MTYRRLPNFFERQTQARNNCRKLIILLIVAVLAIIAAIYFAFRLICFIYVNTNIISINNPSDNLSARSSFLWWDPSIFIPVFAVVILFILASGIIKIRQLQKGGGAVAQMLGGRRIANGTNIPSERQLINIVEEMSISAGIPVPLVYILDKEKGINAFAAGLTINDAAVAVTQGALDRLTRNELQGVIAHEFSHILNGDMRLNIQLIGIIYGILVMGIIGGEILEHHRISSKSMIIFIGGLLLTIIGYIGTFAGRLIQSAVSRQKEFLADASAVKFTRNPLGLASALKKIGGYIYGSKIASAAAGQASHLFFGKTETDALFPDFLATHPPLIERIMLLDPSFDGTFPVVKNSIPVSQPETRDNAVLSATGLSAASPGSMPVTAKAADLIDYVGNPNSDNLEYGSEILASIREQLKIKLQTPRESAAVIYALLLGNECRERDIQLNAVGRSLVMSGNNDDFLHLCDLTAELKEVGKLPLVELAIPSLRGLTAAEKRDFLEIIDDMIQADGKITLFEFFIQWITRQYLAGENKKLLGGTTFSHISQVGYQISIILRVLANAGNKGNADAAHQAFNAGMARIPELACKNPVYYYTEDIDFAEISTALKKLDSSSFKIKQVIVDACAHCAFSNQKITAAEAELLRVISFALHCPLPPFTPDKSQN